MTNLNEKTGPHYKAGSLKITAACFKSLISDARIVVVA